MKQFFISAAIIIGGCLIGMTIIHYIASIPIVYINLKGKCIRVESPDLSDSCDSIPQNHIQVITGDK